MGELVMPDLTKYWGVTVSSIELNHLSMSLKLTLFWTTDNKPRHATLIFKGMSKLDLVGDKVFESDIVELVSLEAVANAGNIDVQGELSNYYFSVQCKSIDEREVSRAID